MLEIERKFLIKKLPDLGQLSPIRYERYFVENDNNKQVRVQKKGDKYELETKIKISELEFNKNKKQISEAEFLKLSKQCDKSIIRDSYLISRNPHITLKKYYGTYDGLIRGEIEYDDKEQIKTFVLPDWLGIEITGTKLANDNKLISLNRTQFLKEIEVFKANVIKD